VYNYPRHYIVWLFSLAIFIYMAYYIRRKHRTITVRTYADHLIGYVWITFGVVIFLVAFLIGSLLAANIICIKPVILALYGMPIFYRVLFYNSGPWCWAALVLGALRYLPFIKNYDYQF